jgi:hypothetical protein
VFLLFLKSSHTLACLEGIILQQRGGISAGTGVGGACGGISENSLGTIGVL